MSEGWVEVSLADLVDIKHGFAFKGEYFTDEPSEAVLLTPGNFAIGGGFQFNKLKFYKDGPIPSDYVLSPGDLLVTMTDLSKAGDTLGYSALVPASQYVLLHNQRLGRISIKAQDVDIGFIHWLLRTDGYRSEILGSATGSTVRHTSPNRIGAFRFLLPPLTEQRAIAATLGALDDKIELNRKMNATLEAMARALFRDWFIDFGPTRAKMEGRTPYLAPDLWSLFPDRLDAEGKPEGWEAGNMSDLANRILACIRELATNPAITDTIWLGDRGITVCEELEIVAAELDDALDDAKLHMKGMVDAGELQGAERIADKRGVALTQINLLAEGQLSNDPADLVRRSVVHTMLAIQRIISECETERK